MSTKFYIHNEIENAIAVVSSENAQFPLSNLNDPRRTKVFRSTENSTTLTMDFGYPVLVNTVMIVDDPMTGNKLSSCHVLIDNDPLFGSAFEQDMIIDSINGISIVNFDTTIPVRYLRLEMNSAAGFCEIAKLFAGSNVDIGEVDFAFPFTYQGVDRSNVTKNRFGGKFVDEINTQKRIVGSMKVLDKDELDGMLSIVDYCGTTKPLWVQFDSIMNNPSRLSGYYHFANIPHETLDTSLYWSLPVELEEAL